MKTPISHIVSHFNNFRKNDRCKKFILRCLSNPKHWRFSVRMFLDVGLLAFFSQSIFAQADSLSLWRANAPLCIADKDGKNPRLELDCGSAQKELTDSHSICFPTKGSEDQSQPCDDGDMTLFNGLLCSAGIEQGCSAVASSQDEITGRWFRSPRRRLIGEQGTENSFSPDMAIGVYLWFAANPSPENTRKFERWIDWIGANKRCMNEDCSKEWPRFCPDDDTGSHGAEFGCTFRPGDLAALGVVVNKFNVQVNDAQFKSLLETWRQSAISLAWLSAHINDTGYSLHLAAGILHLYKNIGVTDAALTDAANSLHTRQPKNPYFSLLAEDKQSSALLLRDECPSTQNYIKPMSQRNQWSWERDDSSEAWRNSMLWDCIFLSALIAK